MKFSIFILHNYIHFFFFKFLSIISVSCSGVLPRFLKKQTFFFKNTLSNIFGKPFIRQFEFCINIKQITLNFSNLTVISPNLYMFSFTSKDLSSVKYILKILALCSWFKFDHLIDLTATDFLGKKFCNEKTRFQLTYLVTSLLNKTIFQKLQINFSSSEFKDLLTVSDLFPNAGWAEREIWDFFGIRFRNNIDLRRILNDYGFRGFPLRKDFPTVGFKQVKYDETQDSVVYEDLFLMQEERESNFINPWVLSMNKTKRSFDFFKTVLLRYSFLLSFISVIKKN